MHTIFKNCRKNKARRETRAEKQEIRPHPSGGLILPLKQDCFSAFVSSILVCFT